MYRILLLALATSLLVVLSAPAPPLAQERWSWPERGENLQQLPADLGGRRLAQVMTGFSRALGVRCHYCHLGEEGQDFLEWDFVSDEKPAKRTARTMLAMLGAINEGYLDSVETSGSERANFWCHSCHSGRPRPLTLEEELGEALAAGGATAATARYAELHERFFGRGAYDFLDERPLAGAGYQRLEAGDLEGAIAIFELYTDQFPASANSWDSLGEAHLGSGNLAEAEAHYRRSLELDPDNTNAQNKLEEIAARR